MKAAGLQGRPAALFCAAGVRMMRSAVVRRRKSGVRAEEMIIVCEDEINQDKILYICRI